MYDKEIKSLIRWEYLDYILAITGSAIYAGVLLAIGVILGGYCKTLSSKNFLISFSEYTLFIPKVIGVISIITFFGVLGSLYFSINEKESQFFMDSYFYLFNDIDNLYYLLVWPNK